MTYAVVDVRAGAMRYARAGHNPLIQLEAGTGKTRVLTPPGLGLGLDPGDRFDEILRGGRGAARERRRVPLLHRRPLRGHERPRRAVRRAAAARMLADSAALASEEIKERILAEVRAFAGGAAQHDDMTMVHPEGGLMRAFLDGEPDRAGRLFASRRPADLVLRGGQGLGGQGAARRPRRWPRGAGAWWPSAATTRSAASSGPAPAWSSSRGRLVVPGFNDAHVHFLTAASACSPSTCATRGTRPTRAAPRRSTRARCPRGPGS